MFFYYKVFIYYIFYYKKFIIYVYYILYIKFFICDILYYKLIYNTKMNMSLPDCVNKISENLLERENI